MSLSYTNLDVVPVAGLLPARGGGGGRGRVRVGQQEVVPQLAQEADGRPVLEVAVQVLKVNVLFSYLCTTSTQITKGR